MTSHQAATHATIVLRQPSPDAAELATCHQRAYRAGWHAEVIRITKLLNALCGLTSKRPIDLTDDVQRDYDEECAHGWSAGGRYRPDG
jgi:hypothetical protein